MQADRQSAGQRRLALRFRNRTSSYVKKALTPSAQGPGYGYLWWLNTKGKTLQGMPETASAALVAGSNTVLVSLDHDLMIVWCWHAAMLPSSANG